MNFSSMDSSGYGAASFNMPHLNRPYTLSLGLDMLYPDNLGPDNLGPDNLYPDDLDRDKMD